MIFQVSWGLVPKHACGPAPAVCTKSQNMGWRYYCFTAGALTLLLWTVRFAMPFLESPRYLVGKGQDEEAIKVIHKIARINGKTSSLTIEQLLPAGGEKESESGVPPESIDTLSYTRDALRHTKGLFATSRMAWSTFLLFMITCKCYVSPLIFLQ